MKKNNEDFNDIFKIYLSQKPSKKLSFFYSKYLKNDISRKILLKIQEEIKTVI